MDWYQDAEKKLNEKGGTFDRYGKAMKEDVKRKLLEFCRQSGEFAQAVAQGGTFSDCMKAVGKQVKGGHISDLDAYRAAAAFYFPTAEIRCVMTIDTEGRTGAEDQTPEPIRLDLVDLADFGL